MNFSSIVPEQREKEHKALRSFLAKRLIGSAALHIVVRTLSRIWVGTPEPAEEPIRVMVFAPPSLQAASIGGAVTTGGSGRGSGKKSLGGLVAAGGFSRNAQQIRLQAA